MKNENCQYKDKESGFCLKVGIMCNLYPEQPFCSEVDLLKKIESLEARLLKLENKK